LVAARDSASAGSVAGSGDTDAIRRPALPRLMGGWAGRR
jgi:hypothetical protein